MRKMRKFFGAFFVAVFLSLQATSAFATNPYGINYGGGEPLGASNVQIEPEMIGDLSPILVSSYVDQVRWSDSLRWKDGYAMLNSNCANIKYIDVWGSDTVSADDDISFEIITDKNVFDVRIENVYIEGDYDFAEGERSISVVNSRQGVLVGAGYSIYNDATCEEARADIVSAKNSGLKVFVELRIKVFNSDKSELFKSRSLHFSIRDIDAKQSYKILNEENALTPERMFAESAELLQPTNTDERNMFVDDGSYIYASDKFNIIDGKNHIYVPVDPDVQEDGLRVVFGFNDSAAASTIAYYARQYVVNYLSDENGEIIGIEEENVVADGNPTGSESEPNEEYEFDYWIADVDVTLEDGTEIEAGEKLTPEQVTQVVVNSNITFTAIHDTLQYDVLYFSDENGEITGIEIERVDPEGNPTGSESKPNEGYEFDYWYADVDVTLKDGTEIKAEEKMTPEQVKQVVVDKDIWFVAVHAPKEAEAPKVPNTGLFTRMGIGGKIGIVAGGIAIIMPIAYAIINAVKIASKRKSVKRF